MITIIHHKTHHVVTRLSAIFVLTVLILGLGIRPASGQSTGPVTWNVSARDLGQGLHQVFFTARITSPWHMYDLGPYEAGGPNATTFSIVPSSDFELLGSVSPENPPIRVDDPIMGMEIGYYERKAVFIQKLRLKKQGATFKTTIEWMVCDDQSCQPPEEETFTLQLTGSIWDGTSPHPGNQSDSSRHSNGRTSNPTDSSDTGIVGSSGTSIGDTLSPTQTETPVTENPISTQTQDSLPSNPQGTLSTSGAIHTDTDNSSTTTSSTPVVSSSTTTQDVTGDESTLSTTSSTSDDTSRPLRRGLIEAILWGFAALLTPCVFPMVPMTVSFFLKGSENKARGRFRALIYGLSIVALYTLPIAAIIAVTRWVGGDVVTADIFNWLATHWLPNVIFFLVFMIFAASFFGAFELTIPSRLVNRSDRKADGKGLGAVFFMALTLVLVSFSCTGPIVGSVLIQSTSGQIWEPVLTMLAFSAAFALPFTLFALFPSLMHKLPKSGGWLNSVKVVLGFIELALGLKFLSVADQTYHWGLLDREVYLALWIVIFSLLGLYLLGKLRFKHDSEVQHLSVGRLFLAIIVFSFVVYLLPGMWGAPLNGISGYLPPYSTQDFTGSTSNAATSSTTTQRISDYGRPKYSDFLHLPHGLEGFFDLAEAEEYARRVGKPLFVDFTGHGCVNCREMEQRVWSDPRILNLLRNDFVIVALYSDDKKEVPESEWIVTPGGKTLKGLGKINSYLARERFGVNAQPYYAILGADGEQLVPGRGYDLDVDAFVRFLESGLSVYNAQR